MKFNDGKTIFADVRSKLHSGYITIGVNGDNTSEMEKAKNKDKLTCLFLVFRLKDLT